MTFEDLVVLDVPQLPEGHPAHYLEYVIKGVILKKKDIHDAEHLDMLKSWGYDPEENGDYTVLNERNGHADRFWHIALHLRYWKENDMHTQYVNEFEEKFPLVKLEEIPLP
jgi:hypothetical protein